MKAKAYQDSKLKHQLRIYFKDDKKMSLEKQLLFKELNGKKELYWKLSKEQVNYVRSLGYNVEPVLYYVHTHRFSDFLRKRYPLLDQLHNARINGKSYLSIKLSRKAKIILQEQGINFNPFKYRITLRR